MPGKKPCSSFGAGLPIKKPECFYGREKQIERFFAELQLPGCQPKRVLGLRRSGKTSFLFHLANKVILQQQLSGAHPKVAIAYLDASDDITTPHDFYTKAAISISQAVKDYLEWAEIKLPKDFPTALSFQQWIESLFEIDSDLKLAVLIDEFEALCENPSSFPSGFWGSLRAFVSRYGGRFIIATASFVDLHQLGISNKAASHFWNVFHPTPIILGALENHASRALITDCAKSENISVSAEEIDNILQISGVLPYFIQATVDVWLKLRKNGKLPEQCTEAVLKSLLSPNDLIVKQFDWYWKHISPEQRSFLSQLAHKPTASAGKDIEWVLEDYGLIVRDENELKIAGELFRLWIIGKIMDPLSSKLDEIHILHLSDLHLKDAKQADVYRIHLETDLIQELKVKRLEYLIISGDVCDHAAEDEYKAAVEMLDKLVKNFGLDANRVILVPGNHDMNRNSSKNAYGLAYQNILTEPTSEGRYYKNGDDVMLCNEVLYRQRFANFNAHLYKHVLAREYPLDFSEQATIIERPEDHILFLGLNSSWEIDHHYRLRASINGEALSKALDHFNGKDYDGWLKIAIFHHPVTGKETMNDEFMQLLTVHGFQICMHGHIHESANGLFNYDKRGIRVIGAGTFGAPSEEQAAGIPLQYNLLIFDPRIGQIEVRTRKKEKINGAWSADSRWGDKNDPKPYYSFPVQNYRTCRQT
ncbi:MAG TPA: hypothetical protein HA232_00565 [Methanocellales archaeon]|nr:hypothetical protein [Methanocellales archaeon]